MYAYKYDITALAMLYFGGTSPTNARRRFLYLLRSERDLWEQLQELHFSRYQRTFTPRQYELVVRVLGCP